MTSAPLLHPAHYCRRSLSAVAKREQHSHQQSGKQAGCDRLQHFANPKGEARP